MAKDRGREFHTGYRCIHPLALGHGLLFSLDSEKPPVLYLQIRLLLMPSSALLLIARYCSVHRAVYPLAKK